MSNSSAVFKLASSFAGPLGGTTAPPTVTLTAPYQASSESTIDIPDATAAATDFDVPFGSVASATAVLLKNQGNQALDVSFGASEDVAFELPPGAMVLYASPTDPTTPLASITVTTTAEQDGEGKVACMVFGDPIADV